MSLQDDDPSPGPTREPGGGAQEPPAGVPTLLTGRRASHFEVAERLGGGGMGVLYRAEDTRLGRTVALKFLAPELVRSPAAKARFLTEARAASALEHPNLCTILDVGETADGLLFLAMPLYAGESLEKRLERGPLPVAEAVDVATQAARGLAKAHRHGIVHRDIRPANLFLTDDGVVKVLGFGIAKLADEAGSIGESASGTPFYLAPEQTLGHAVDARADVWSLGVVLYQMLAGEVPPEIEAIVAGMLHQDPEQRYANAGEVLVDLRRAQGLDSVTLSPESPVRRRRAGGLLAGLLGLLLAGVVGGVGLLLWRRGREGPVGHPTYTRLTDFPGKETFPSLAPDGRTFVYVRSVGGRSDLFSQSLAGGPPVDLTAGWRAASTQPAYSPDGRQIAFRSERDGGGIFVMGAAGGAVRRLARFGFNPAWSPDGRQIAVATESAVDPSSRESNSQIYGLDLRRGTRRSLGVPDGVQPSWSPHGGRIAFWGVTQAARRRGIWTVAAGGGTPVPVVEDAFLNWSPVWSPDGTFLYFASNRGGSMNLWRVAIDERTGAVRGVPQPITTPSEWSALPSFSRDGRRLVYAGNESRSFVEQVAFDPASGRTRGAPGVVFQGARPVWACDLSPDGQWLVYRTASPQEDLHLIRLDGGEHRQLTNDPYLNRAPRWSPDGSRILFSSNRSGKYETWTIRPDGSALTQVTHLPAHGVHSPAWSPDGRQIGFTYGPRGAAVLDLGAPAAGPRVLPPTAEGLVLARVSWSGDGGFLAGQLQRRDESAIPGVVLWSLADNSHRRLTQTGSEPVFFHRGRQILFTEPDAIRLVDVASGEVRTLLSAPLHSFYVNASVAPDDRTVCTVRTTEEGDIWLLSLAGAAGRP